MLMNDASETKKVPTALIFGITGQDGAYLAEHLHTLGYEVHGVIRRSSSMFTTQRLESVFSKLRDNLHYGDIGDALSVSAIISDVHPDEIYNLAAQSHVKVSFEQPLYTSSVNALGILHVLEACRSLKLLNTRIYQASTSEMFGGDEKDYTKEEWEKCMRYGMNETTSFFPKSPYGAAKLYAHNLVQIYRASYGMHVVSGILFNHESENRDPRFVTRKVTYEATRMVADWDKLISGKKLDYHGDPVCIRLGNLDAERDWGYAPDYVKAMHLMMQEKSCTDYVIATGVVHSVRYMVELVFSKLGKKVVWSGSGVDEIGVDDESGYVLVRVNKKLYRPNEVHKLRGDASLAHQRLGWKPEKQFADMIGDMVESDMKSGMKGGF